MSQATYYRLTPLDTALFRDARPFSAEDSGGARLGFWTPPQLGVLGAFRNLLLEEARCNYEEFKNGGDPLTGGGVLGIGFKFGQFVLLLHGECLPENSSQSGGGIRDFKHLSSIYSWRQNKKRYAARFNCYDSASEQGLD